MIFHVSLKEAEDGWVVAECPALPGCVSQGKDEKEALENIKEAITAWLWAEDQKAVMSKPGERANLSIPQHKELSVGTLRSLIRSANLTVDQFLDLV